ncbi:MAG TPA: FAD-dependent oxidoreductase [Myxococcota bacterium]|nr:FAD-dependent oxidoreductase [Myxococcota bacterium]
MPQSRKEFDVVVIGAGSAGSACALFLTLAGRRVALLESRPLEQAGARWVNGVPAWMFEQAGLATPAPPESRGVAPAFVVTDAALHSRLRVEPSPVTTVDMPRLCARLHRLCNDAGVEIFDRFHTQSLKTLDARPVSLAGEVRTTARSARGMIFKAALFVDASGMAGALRGRVPALDEGCGQVENEHLCSAAQEVCEVADRAGAEEFLSRNHLRPGEVLAATGVDGGFSTSSLQLDADLETVDLLTGSIAGPGHRGGPALMGELKKSRPWIGRRISGGSGLVPLRRSYDRLVAPGIALVGDAACQVFPAHGSGTGAGLLAARALANAVVGKLDPGSLDALWTYQADWQRGFGSLCAAYDVFRRYSQLLDGDELAGLLGSGILGPASFKAGLEQVMPRQSFAELSVSLRALARAPRLWGLVPQLARMGAARALYRRYPQARDQSALARWSAAASWLFGDNSVCS